jgi:hypothetical protein
MPARPLATGLRVFHRPIPDATMILRGWPAIPGARRYSNLHSVRRTFAFKAPPRDLSTHLPSLDPIKGKAGDLPRGTTDNEQRRTNNERRKPQDIPQLLRSTSQAIYSFFPLLETWGRIPLSQLVTPTQTLRCKEIQNSPPAGRRAFFARTRIKSRVFSLHHHPD